MAVKTLEEFAALFGDEPSERDVALLEDIADTIEALSVNTDEEALNARVNEAVAAATAEAVAETEAAWRKRYIERFKRGDEKEVETVDEKQNGDETFDDVITYEKEDEE